MNHRLEDWLANPLLGVLIMALLGGFLSHIRAIAAAMPAGPLTWQHYISFALRCMLAFSIRMFGAALGGLMVVFFWRAQEWQWEYGFVAAGMVGLFSTEAFEWLWLSGRRYLEVRLGVPRDDHDAR